ncbi:hypothetical protein M23134_03084 [Microscilla marina ATCC 23134]|uniref:Uncharacterized protein n=1 Tax=Microscilla marina ATCC 23134 TaxID=313606 RepID=A1ZG31_MICM2|nr:hypothetical protein M23134_03084 [Microscilla marina ATCC 23134]
MSKQPKKYQYGRITFKPLVISILLDVSIYEKAIDYRLNAVDYC